MSPNVVIVLTTQWRSSACGYSGDPNASTPCLDALARESVNFSQAVTPHPFGVFARAALLTGRRSPENGVADYFDPLPVQATTLAHRFGRLGYETAFVGKWGLFERDPNAPIVGEEHARIFVPIESRGGFSYWDGFESGFLLNDPFFHGDSNSSPTRAKGYQSDLVIDRFCQRHIGRSDIRPLFALLSLDAPHPPYAAPAGGVNPARPETIALRDNVPAIPEIRDEARRELAGYYAHIEATDRAIGRLVARLKQSKQWENTIFVFTSAHGDMHGSCGKFRKGWPHEESVRVPMLFSWPRSTIRPRSDRMLISLLDLGPTLLRYCGGEEEAAFSGMDLSGAILAGVGGPSEQVISMPSVPPFAKQCPYIWTATRSDRSTLVRPAKESAFTLDHAVEPNYL